jgi:cell division protein FtsB
MIGFSLLVLWAVAVPLAGAWVLQQERARVDVTVTRSAELQAQVSELRSELSILRAELGLLREELESLREVARAPNR